MKSIKIQQILKMLQKEKNDKISFLKGQLIMQRVQTDGIDETNGINQIYDKRTTLNLEGITANELTR
jgi:hypothetical protein